jgi:RNA polymerase sigma-70 factor (ECF subfamily)
VSLDGEPQARLEEKRAAADFDAAVERMLTGDESAFINVYRALQPGLLRYLTVLVGVNDAEDVASETWGQACRDLAKFTGDGDGFRGWVTTIGRHRALDRLRALGRRPIADVRVEDVANQPHVADAESTALESLSTAAALRLIAALPRDQAEAVLLRAVVGLDAKTAGNVLGKRAGAVRTAAYRGLRRLSEEMSLAQVEPPRTDPASGDTSELPDAEEVS